MVYEFLDFDHGNTPNRPNCTIRSSPHLRFEADLSWNDIIYRIFVLWGGKKCHCRNPKNVENVENFFDTFKIDSKYVDMHIVTRVSLSSVHWCMELLYWCTIVGNNKQSFLVQLHKLYFSNWIYFLCLNSVVLYVDGCVSTSSLKWCMNFLYWSIFNIVKFKKTENIIIFRHLKKSRDQPIEKSSIRTYMSRKIQTSAIWKIFVRSIWSHRSGIIWVWMWTFLTRSKLVFGLSFRVLKHSVDEFYISRWGIFLFKR